MLLSGAHIDKKDRRIEKRTDKFDVRLGSYIQQQILFYVCSTL